MDGANTTGAEIGNQGKVLNFEFIQEVEFKSGGYEAEYGGAQGGILNVVTKSGGNEFHGDAFGYFNANSLQADEQAHRRAHLRRHPDGLHQGRLRRRHRRLRPQGPAVVLRRLRPRPQLAGHADHAGPGRGHRRHDQPPDDQQPLLRQADLAHRRPAHPHRNRLRRPDERRRRGRPGHRASRDLHRHGHRRRHRLRRPLRGDPVAEVARDRRSSPTTARTSRRCRAPAETWSPSSTTPDAVSIASGGFQGSDGTGQWDTKKFTRYDYRASGNWFLADHDVKFGGEFERVNADVFRTYSGGQFVTILPPYRGRHARTSTSTASSRRPTRRSTT